MAAGFTQIPHYSTVSYKIFCQNYIHPIGNGNGYRYWNDSLPIGNGNGYGNGNDSLPIGNGNGYRYGYDEIEMKVSLVKPMVHLSCRVMTLRHESRLSNSTQTQRPSKLHSFPFPFPFPKKADNHRQLNDFFEVVTLSF